MFFWSVLLKMHVKKVINYQKRLFQIVMNSNALFITLHHSSHSFKRLGDQIAHNALLKTAKERFKKTSELHKKLKSEFPTLFFLV